MPMPWTYRHASKEWRSFLGDVKERTGLTSDNMAYTAIDGVFRVFRARLAVRQGLRFAAVLPAVPRAIFVKDWDTDAEVALFTTREEMTAEAQALRPDHNLTPDNAIEAVAFAVRRHVRPDDLDRALDGLPQGAVEFWEVSGVATDALRPRII